MTDSVEQSTNEILPHGCYITIEEPDTEMLDISGKPIHIVDRGHDKYFSVDQATAMRDALTIALEGVDD
jgi:hypothetical protein